MSPNLLIDLYIKKGDTVIHIKIFSGVKTLTTLKYYTFELFVSPAKHSDT